jgi:hypothetical protein
MIKTKTLYVLNKKEHGKQLVSCQTMLFLYISITVALHVININGKLQ